MLQVNRASQITLLTSPELERVPGVVHAFSTRRAEHSSFTLGPSPSENPAVQLNRARFLAAAGMPGWPLLKLKQIHSGIVRNMQDTLAANDPVEGDAAVTALKGAVLAIQTADCVPILLADRKGRAIGAIHAGWRGAASDIAHKTVRVLVEEYGLLASDIVAVIGPHNAACCYEVGSDVVDAIGDPAVFVSRPGKSKLHLDLAAVNRKQLLKAGIPAEQIQVSTLCTSCRADLFYSYRREGSSTGRLLSIIGLTP
jgi:YfiH family protein